MDELKWARRMLGVSRHATSREVREAFRLGAKRHHPDAGGDARMFADLKKAYEIARAAAPPAREDEVRVPWTEAEAARKPQPSATAPRAATRHRVTNAHDSASRPGFIQPARQGRDIDRLHRSFADILNQQLGYV